MISSLFLAASAPGKGTEASAHRRRDVPLDGLRGIAIWMVLVWHFYACQPHPTEGWWAKAINSVAVFGWAGVPVFFVLSGFLIGRILIAARSQGDYFVSFYLRRTCRILPPYVLLLALAALGIAIVLPTRDAFWHHSLSLGAPPWAYGIFVQNMFMAQNGHMTGWLAVTWSLAIEEQFYLLLPLVVRVVAPPRLGYVLVAGLVACWLFRMVGHLNGAGTHVLMLTLPGRADGLLLGVLMAWAWQIPGWQSIMRRNLRPLILLAGGTMALFLALNQGWGPRVGAILFVVFAFSMISLPVAVCILTTLARPDGILARALSFRLFVFSGSISYFVYLFHTPVNAVMHALLLQDVPRMDTKVGVGVTFLSLAALGLLGWISLRYVEAPIQAWGRRFRAIPDPTADERAVTSTSTSAVRTTPP